MIREERRDGGEGEERGLRKGAEREKSLKRIGTSTLASVVVQLPQDTAFLLSYRLNSAVKRCSSEILVSSGVAW